MEAEAKVEGPLGLWQALSLNSDTSSSCWSEDVPVWKHTTLPVVPLSCQDLTRSDSTASQVTAKRPDCESLEAPVHPGYTRTKQVNMLSTNTCSENPKYDKGENNHASSCVAMIENGDEELCTSPSSCKYKVDTECTDVSSTSASLDILTLHDIEVVAEQLLSSKPFIRREVENKCAIPSALSNAPHNHFGCLDVTLSDVVVGPTRLYDREHEQKVLLGAYERCCIEAVSVSETLSPTSSTSQNPSNLATYCNESESVPLRNLILVAGPSGTGKTALIVETLKQRVRSDGGYFLSGKFDQLERTESYYPIVQAMSCWVNDLLLEQNEEVMNVVREELERITETEHLLLDMIPDLQRILDTRTNDLATTSDAQRQRAERRSLTVLSSCSELLQKASASFSVGAQKRLIYTFCQFLYAVCSPERPMILFLDDLQWADPATLNLLVALVGGVQYGGVDAYLCNKSSSSHIHSSTESCMRGLMIVGACRGNEVGMDHQLSVMMREIESDKNVQITLINTANLSCAAIAPMIAHALQQPVQKSMPLADFVYQQTKGNVFCVIQLLKYLLEEGLLLQQDEENKQDCEDIVTEIRLRFQDSFFDDAVNLLTARIKRLPKQVQDMVVLASCLGSEFDEKILQLIVTFEVDEPLMIAAEKGLLYKRPLSCCTSVPKRCSRNGRDTCSCVAHGSPDCTSSRGWLFVHDQVQQSAYMLIPKDQRDEVHLSIGRRLWSALPSEELHKHAFLVVSQLRKGASLMSDPEERDRMATLLLEAGEKASQSSSFATAASYLSLGISFLKERHWRDQYDLSLSLFNAAAEVEYCKGNFEKMDELIDEVLQNARSNVDKIRALTSSIYALGTRKELQKATELGLKVLRDLGEPFPRNPGTLTVLLELRKTKKQLKQYKSDSQLLNIPLMRDEIKLSVMRIMIILHASTVHVQPLIAPLIGMRLVQLTLKYGMSRMASVGFAVFAMLQCVVFDDIALGTRYGQVALDIWDKFGSKEWQARTHLVVFGFCLVHKQPWRELLKPLLVSHRVGLGSGDIECSMLSATLYCGLGIYSSVPLASLYHDAKAFLALMTLHKQAHMIEYLQPNMQFMMNMMGKCADPCQLTGSAMNFENAMKEAVETRNQTMISYLLLFKLALCSFFRKYEEAEKVALDLSKQNCDTFSCFNKVSQWLHEGLVAAILSDKQRRRRLAVARQCLRKLKYLDKQSNAIIVNKVYLLEAEIDVATGKVQQGIEKYRLAANKAAEEQLWSDVGLAHERAAHALHKAQKYDESIADLEQSAIAYEQWGACAKVADVRNQIVVWSSLP